MIFAFGGVPSWVLRAGRFSWRLLDFPWTASQPSLMRTLPSVLKVWDLILLRRVVIRYSAGGKKAAMKRRVIMS